MFIFPSAERIFKHKCPKINIYILTFISIFKFDEDFFSSLESNAVSYVDFLYCMSKLSISCYVDLK